MKKSKNLVLAGYHGLESWNCGCGAMVVRALKGDCVVYPCHHSELPDRLEEVGRKFKTVYLVCIDAYRSDSERLTAVLQKLKAEGVKVLYAVNRWGGIVDALLEQGLWEPINPLGVVVPSRSSHPGHDLDLPAYLEKVYGIKTEDLQISDFIWGRAYVVADVDYVELVNVALWHLRHYEREDVFQEMIYAMARGEKSVDYKPVLTKAITHYRQYGRRDLVGSSEVMRELWTKIKTAAKYPDARVMILGETGTGKEAVAFHIHYGSSRRDKKYVPFNCATVNAELLESRLFGHEKGSFTGAGERKKGLFEEADGGTLFLDEIGELKLEVQGLLLRALEVGRIMRVGGTEEVPVNVRLITATNRDLPKMVREGKFRADLYQRLSLFPIVTPPLRAHKEDIGTIVGAWYSSRLKPNALCPPEPTEGQILQLMDYDYPGNVRELLNVVERAQMLNEPNYRKLLDEQKSITASLQTSEKMRGPGGVSETKADHVCTMMLHEEGLLPLEEVMRAYVSKVHKRLGDHITKTAEVLAVSRNTVRKYLKKV